MREITSVFLPARVRTKSRMIASALGVRMRIVSCLLTVFLFAGCADENGLRRLPIDQIRARFPPGGVVDVIEVDAINRLPLRSAELIAPDGQATPASYLNVSPSPSVAYSQGFSNGPYAGNAFGVSNLASGAPFSAEIVGGPQTSAQLLAIVSTASITLPDEIGYRRDWRSYRIFLSFGDLPSEVERRVLPAPEPPPNG